MQESKTLLNILSNILREMVFEKKNRKSAYKYSTVTDLERLRCYDRFFIPVHALVWLAS
jgi:hypothetical protein